MNLLSYILYRKDVVFLYNKREYNLKLLHKIKNNENCDYMTTDNSSSESELSDYEDNVICCCW